MTEDDKYCYYAHCLNIFNTPQEKRDIDIIKQLGFIPMSPNFPGADDGYKENGMVFFFDMIRTCEALSFRALPDGSIPAGVGEEIQFALSCPIPIFELPRMIVSRSLSVEETRAYLQEIGER